MRLAAIDIGTNSLHMIVVEVRADLSFEVIDREKQMVRLGAGGLDGKALTPEAMGLALQVLSKFSRLAASHGVDHIIAGATSAVREAENGGEFLHAIVSQTGIRARVISGTEEARLIHLAAAYGLGLSGEVGVVIDIGGGSVEITRGMGASMELGRSFKVGVIRLTERFVKSDPISKGDERKLVRHIQSQLDSHLAAIVKAGYDRVIGTSGTILSLGAIVAGESDRPDGNAVRNRRVSAKQLRKVRKQLTELPLEKRLQVPGLEPRRADLAVSGAILLDTILKRLEADEISLCDLSLREGLILDYIAKHRKEIAQADRYPDVRRRSVIELAERCSYWPDHANHIARLGLAVFDRTRGIHALTDQEREWLEYAAILHDSGVHISYERHHKHSYYLIKNGDLRGFEPDEIETIALVARYHRRAAPDRRHVGFRALRKKRRRIVRILAAILRLAENLDRSHAQTISSIEFLDRGEDALLQVRTAGDAELELWAAQRHSAPFERVIGKPLRFEVNQQAVPQPLDAAPRVAAAAPVRRRGEPRPGETARVAVLAAANSGARPSRTQHRMELVRARQSRNAMAEAEGRAVALDLQPAARQRLRR